MTDPELLERHYDESALQSLVSSLKILVNLRFFETVADVNHQLLVECLDENEEALLKKIRNYQQTRRVYLDLADLAKTFIERNNHVQA